MKPTQTGIAVALALAVVIAFFILPGLWPWGTTAAPVETPAQITTNTQNPSTTMPTEPVTELMMKDDVVGTGAIAATGDSVTVNYVGSFTNGTVFDASASHQETVNGFTFLLGAGKVIQGWDEGVVGMKVGGKRTLVVPASLGYGPNDYGPIPGNSALVFEVELLKVQKSAQ